MNINDTDAIKTRKEIGSLSTFFDSLLFDSCIEGASDIHIDPEEHQVCIKLRINGDISEYCRLDKEMHDELIGRIKILARLRTDIHDKGQDGRFAFKLEKKAPDGQVNFVEKADVRVSVLPTFFGENAVCRILRPEQKRNRKLVELGMFPDQADTIIDEIKKEQGMIIVAGPTGAGKTTTIYTIISLLLGSGRNIVTIEDPIEYLIPGIRQIQISELADFGFSKALRSILRQDPDVIVIGEMRDGETAALAFQAALTGHLVITSLHAEDSAGVCGRLRDLGISNQLLHTLTLIISQRLLKLKANDEMRSGIFEVMSLEGNIKLALFQNSFPEYIRATLKKHGALLMDDAIERKKSEQIDYHKIETDAQ